MVDGNLKKNDEVLTVKDFPALLDAMLEDQALAEQIYHPGPYWQPYQDRAVAAIKRYGIGDFLNNPLIGKGFANTFMPLPLGYDGKFKSRVVKWLAMLPGIRNVVSDQRNQISRLRYRCDALRAELLYLRHRDWFNKIIDEYGFPESNIAGAQGGLKLESQTINTKYLLTALRLRTFKEHTTLQHPNSFMEIGGGFGAFTHLLLTLMPTVRKVIYVDIPPMIYLGTQYLKCHFGTAVRDYLDLRNKDEIRFESAPGELEILCLCPWQLEKLKADVNIFYNCSSFSEMTPDRVANYSHHIQRLLSDDGEVWLVPNLHELKPNARICLPDEMANAFSPAISFTSLEPFEQNQVDLWWLGRRQQL